MSCFEAQLSEAVGSNSVGSIERTTVLADAQTAYPKEIQQAESQLMVYVDNMYVVSPYQVSAQTTEVRVVAVVRCRMVST